MGLFHLLITGANLDLYTFGSQFIHYPCNTLFINDAHTPGGKPHGDVALFIRQPEFLALQVNIEPAAAFIMGVTYIVAKHGLFAGHVTYSTHDILLIMI